MNKKHYEVMWEILKDEMDEAVQMGVDNNFIHSYDPKFKWKFITFRDIYDLMIRLELQYGGQGETE